MLPPNIANEGREHFQPCQKRIAGALHCFHSKRRKMPPLEAMNGGNALLQHSSSFLIDENSSNHFTGPRDLKVLLRKLAEGNASTDVVSHVNDLLERASSLRDKVNNRRDLHSVMTQAVTSSIQTALTDVLHQAAVILEERDEKGDIVETVTNFSIQRAIQFFDRLETMALEADTEKLESFFQEFSEIEGTRPAIRVSLLSRSLAFEFTAGNTDTANIPSQSEDTLPIQVGVTPYLVVSSDDVAEQSTLLHDYSQCQVKIDFASHKKLFLSSGSGVMGEALVRAYINPGKVVKIPKEGKVWRDSGECGRPDIAEVRAVQTNAFPRDVQTKLDLYISTMHGLSGFIVTMKMKTYKSLNNELPKMDIQLIMKPPTN